MPELPDFIAEPSFANPGTTPGMGQILPEAIQRTAAEVGQTADQFAQNALNLQRETQSAAAFSDGLDKLQSVAAPWSRVPDHTTAHDGFLGDAKSVIAQQTQGITDPVVLARTQAQLGDAAARMAGQVQTSAFDQERNVSLASIQKSALDLGQQLVSAGQDEGLRASINDQFSRAVGAALDSHLIEPTEAETLTRQFVSRGVEVQVEQLRNKALGTRDPEAMTALAQRINDPSQFPGLLPNDRERLGMRAEQSAYSLGLQKDRQEAKAERAQFAWLAVAQGQAHAAYADDLASIARTGQPVSPDTAYHLTQAYPAGKFPGIAAEMIGNLQAAQRRYNLGQRLALASPDEEAGLLAEAAPQGAGFAQQAKTHDDLVAAIAAKHDALAKDPAGYVLQTNPEIGQAYQAAAQDPTRLPQAAAQLDAAYDKLGVPAAARRVLPAGQADNLVKAVLQAPADGRAATLESLAQQAGPLWPRVMGDLVKAGLPPEYNLLAALPDSGARTLFADALGNGKEKLRAALPPADARTIDAALDDSPALAQFRASLASSAGGGELAQNVMAGARALAYRTALTTDPDSAATRAAAAWTTDKYDFWTQAPFVARLPKGLSASIERQAGALVDTLKPEDLAPIDTGTGTPLTDEQRQAVALQNARRGAWVTDETETGLVRVGANGRPVLGANGVRLELPFPPAPGQPAAPVTLPPPVAAVPNAAERGMARDLARSAAQPRVAVHPRPEPGAGP